jgi:serine/threonine protein kinase
MAQPRRQEMPMEHHQDDMENDVTVTHGGGGGGGGGISTHRPQDLTGHVMTRYYRAPEVILQEPYGMPIDLWSAGVCLGELLRSLPLKPDMASGREHLFPGGMCQPWSGPRQDVAAASVIDQLDLIVGQCGGFEAAHVRTMSPNAKKRIAALPHCARTGFDSLAQCVDKTRINEQAIDGCTLAHALDLLNRLLVLDPTQRLSASQALQHPFLASHREPEHYERCFDPTQIKHTVTCDCFRCVEPRSLSLNQQVDLLRAASS